MRFIKRWLRAALIIGVLFINATLIVVGIPLFIYNQFGEEGLWVLGFVIVCLILALPFTDRDDAHD